jgi:hypothetical protein
MQVGDEDGIDVWSREAQCLQLREQTGILVAIAGIEEQLLSVFLQEHERYGRRDAVSYVQRGD